MKQAKKKIITDLDVVTVAKWDKGRNGDTAREFIIVVESGRAVNTTAEHPYLAKLNSKEECDKYAGNVWNKEANEFNGYCTRWIEVRYLQDGNYIAVPKIENDINIDNDANVVVERARSSMERAPLSLRGRCGFENDSKISPRSHLYKKEENQAHSLGKNTSLAKGNFDEFLLDSEIAESHTVISNDDNNYKNLSICGAIKWEKIASIRALEPQHVYDLSIEGTRNFIANDIVAHNTYLVTVSKGLKIKEKNGFHSQAIAPRQDPIPSRTDAIKQYLFKYLSVDSTEILTELGSHSLAIASDRGSDFLHGSAGSNSLSNEMNLPPPASIDISKGNYKLKLPTPKELVDEVKKDIKAGDVE